MPKIDIAIPCYQYGRFLRDCVRSVQSQSVADLRILIIDNASTDDSVEVAQELAQNDPRIEVIAHKTNMGPHASYNEAIDWASSDYFLLLDADDILLPGCLTAAMQILERNDDVVLTYGFDVILDQDQLKLQDVHKSVSENWIFHDGIEYIRHFCETPANLIGPSTVVRRTSAQKTAGYYRPILRHTDDVELWLRFALLGRFAQTFRLQAARRIHAAQVSHETRNNFALDFIEKENAFASFFMHEGRILTDHRKLHALAIRRLKEHAYWSAISHFVRGQRLQSIAIMNYATSGRWWRIAMPPVKQLCRNRQFIERSIDVFREAFSVRTGWPTTKNSAWSFQSPHIPCSGTTEDAHAKKP
jgi:glycosyltransferase involved in cell wall biosynthesis